MLEQIRANKPLRDIMARYPKVKQLGRQLLSGIPLSLRLGRRFWEWYAFFEESESWNSGDLLEFQLDRLHVLLHQLADTSPFYCRRLGDVDIDRITTLEDFRRKVQPLLRSEFRSSYDQIRNTSWCTLNLARSQTSGTTGTALQFYHLADDQPREWAAICHQWRRVGYDPGRSRRAEFRGLTAPGKLTEVFPDQNMMRCSILHLKKQHLLHYASEITANRVDYYHGYPSALYLLATEIIANGLAFPQPHAVLLASEMVYEWQVARIREAFPKAKVFAHYGCAERTVLAGWCEFREEYHVLPQYSLVEVNGENGEIIGTNLYNIVNGFVRYRMTDVALATEQIVCPDCHRPYTPRLLQLGGRTEDYLFSPENGWIPPAIVTYPLKSLKVVQEVQFLQKERTEIDVRYTVRSKGDHLLEQDLEHIKAGVHRLFGSGMKVSVERVDDFQRGPSGKFKWIVCELEDKPLP